MKALLTAATFLALVFFLEAASRPSSEAAYPGTGSGLPDQRDHAGPPAAQQTLATERTAVRLPVVQPASSPRDASPTELDTAVAPVGQHAKEPQGSSGGGDAGLAPLPPGGQDQAQVPAAGPLFLVLVVSGLGLQQEPPGLLAIRVGQLVTLELRLRNPRGQPLDGAEAHLNFDPALLEVVDAGGVPTAALDPGPSLPVLLQNRVDNTRGRIDFAQGRALGGTVPNGSPTLATVRFRAKTASLGTAVSFSTGEPISIGLREVAVTRRSAVAYRGDYVPITLTGATIRVDPAAP